MRIHHSFLNRWPLMSLPVLPLLLLFLVYGSPKSDGKSQNVVLHFGGDVTFANHFERHVGNRYDYPFARMRWFADAHISMVNLENPLTTRGTAVPKQYNFRALPAYTQVLKNGGIDIVTLANNHIYDFAEQGIFDTMHFLDEAGIHFVGAGSNIAEARRPVIIPVNGLRLAFLGYYGTRKHSDSHPATPDSAGTAMRKLTFIREDIGKIRDSVDFISVNLHWGYEKEHYPEPSQVRFAHRIIDYGADLVVGHHPHVLQGVERYRGKTIAYSLGNFIFGGNSRKTDRSAILRITLPVDAPAKYHTELIPIQIDYWQPYRLSGAWQDSIMNNLKEYSSIFEHSIF
jgi:poly-gamma-glutamate synthesis protein (capsule biosynthesis protein)